MSMLLASHARLIDMEIDHLADHERMPVGPKLDHLMQFALEVDRRLGYAR